MDVEDSPDCWDQENVGPVKASDEIARTVAGSPVVCRGQGLTVDHQGLQCWGLGSKAG